jgi:hypothetical protein
LPGARPSRAAIWLRELCRIRRKPLDTRPSQAAMYHIPFDKRHLVGLERYSFPGLPCLYLGGSSYVCWEEVQPGDATQMWCSRFEPPPDATLRVLNLGYRPAVIAAMLEHSGLTHSNRKVTALATAHAALWPLVAACSFKVLNPEAPFKVEYVVPQLLLRWVVRSPDYDGIRYFSTHVQDYRAFTRGMNFVFPTRSNARAGICPTLAAKLLLTEPVDLSSIPRGFRPSPLPGPSTNFSLSYRGKQVMYSDSPFYVLDEYLGTLQVGAP